MADQLAEPSYAPMDPAFAAPTAPSSDSGTHNSNPSMNKVTSSGAILTGGYNTSKIYIGNLPETATLADLEDCFGQLGQCSCSIKRGFGFVEYTDPSSANEAVARYNEGHFLGAQIKVELSHARQPPPKPPTDKGPTRNPPGSDRPSDSRKPMHINGPPGQEKLSRRQKSQVGPVGLGNGPPPSGGNFDRGPPPPDYLRREGPPPPDRYLPGPPGRDMPLPYPDPRYPPPLPYSDARYPPRDYDFPPYGPPRDFRGPPPPAAGYNSNYGPPVIPSGPPRDLRDQRAPYDPYYDSPRGRDDYGGGSYAPQAMGGRPVGPPAPLDRPYNARDPYQPPPLDRYDSRPPSVPLGSNGPPSFDSSRGGPPYAGDLKRPPYDPYIPPPSSMGSPDRYDPRGPAPISRDDRRYNPYARPGSPRDDRRSNANGNGNGGGYGGRSPRGGAPPPERRRSLSPPRRDNGSNGYRNGGDYRAPPPNIPNYPPYDAGRPHYGRPGSPPRYPPQEEEGYNPRR